MTEEHSALQQRKQELRTKMLAMRRAKKGKKFIFPFVSRTDKWRQAG